MGLYLKNVLSSAIEANSKVYGRYQNGLLSSSAPHDPNPWLQSPSPVYGSNPTERLCLPRESDRSLREPKKRWLPRQEGQERRHWSRWSTSLWRRHEVANQGERRIRKDREGCLQDFRLWLRNRKQLLCY